MPARLRGITAKLLGMPARLCGITAKLLGMPASTPQVPPPETGPGTFTEYLLPVYIY